MEGPETVAGLVAWSIFTGTACFVVLAGIVLSYHWFSYAMNKFAAFAALASYSLISCILLALLLSAVMRV